MDGTGRRGVIVSPDATAAPCALSTADITAVLARREEVRARRDFAASDAMREELRAGGVELQDKERSWHANDGRRGSYPAPPGGVGIGGGGVGGGGGGMGMGGMMGRGGMMGGGMGGGMGGMGGMGGGMGGMMAAAPSPQAQALAAAALAAATPQGYQNFYGAQQQQPGAHQPGAGGAGGGAMWGAGWM